MRKFVIGDIHGAYKALTQVLEKSNFNYEKDLLISLGDLCDGWPETSKCLNELLKIKNLIVVLGNHDQWALQWMKHGIKEPGWLGQGGRQTIKSYSNKKVPESHIELLEEAPVYYLDDDNKLFVHAGIDINLPLEKQDEYCLLWDRTFFTMVKLKMGIDSAPPFTNFKEVFIGHSPIHGYGYLQPLKVGDVWLMDTGASWDGVLSMMDLDSYEIYTSEPPVNMYPKGSGRV